MTINRQVQQGKIHYSCFDCANKHRTQPAYNGIYTTLQGVCAICKQTKSVTSAKKLFGYHTFL